MSIPSESRNISNWIQNINQEAEGLKDVKPGQKIQVFVEHDQRTWTVSEGTKEGVWGKSFGRLNQALNRSAFDSRLKAEGGEGGANRKAVVKHLTNFSQSVEALISNVDEKSISENREALKNLSKNLTTLVKTTELVAIGKNFPNSSLQNVLNTYQDPTTKNTIKEIISNIDRQIDTLEGKLRNSLKADRHQNFKSKLKEPTPEIN